MSGSGFPRQHVCARQQCTTRGIPVFPDRTAIVSFANPAVGTVTKPILSGAFKYTRPSDGTNIILVVHQAIYIDTMDHSLLCPMQMQENDVVLDECPKSMTDNPTALNHSMLVHTDTNKTIRIPFRLHGVTSTVYVGTPTLLEYETLPRVSLTSSDLEWDPQNPDFARQEDMHLDHFGEFNPPGDQQIRHRRQRFIQMTSSKLSIAALNSLQACGHACCSTDTVLHSINPALNDQSFINMLQSNRLIEATSTSKRTGLKPEHLAAKWKISLKQAQDTIQATTQRAVRNIANPALCRRFKTNDRMLRYNRVPHTVFTDTLKSSVKSLQKNTYAQVYCTDFLWTRAYPMRKESDAHHTLSAMLKDVGVPNKMVMDNAKAQINGMFRKKLKEADCQVKSTEPHTPFSNAAESAIRELKKGTGRKLTSSRCPKRLWDDCMELEALQRSHTAHDIWQLQGQVPQTIMTGHTADISQLFELEWYEWIMFYESAVRFPEDKMVLGRWLGPSLDTGPAMTGKVLKANGQVVHVSTYWALTESEYKPDVVKENMTLYTNSINTRLGPAASIEELAKDVGDDVKTPQYKPYSDLQTPPYTIPDRDDFQGFDQYIGAEVLLPIGDQMQTAKVHERKRKPDGSRVGTSNSNPLFDTRTYIVEFPDGAEKEYTANIIAENMYSQCNPDGEQFLLLSAIRDHKKTRDAIELKDEGYVHVKGRQHDIKTTKGWLLCVEWKDGTTSWERLSGLKESFPVEVAENAVAAGINSEPAFRWWVPHVLNKRD